MHECTFSQRICVGLGRKHFRDFHLLGGSVERVHSPLNTWYIAQTREAVVFSSAVEARYFFSTAITAAAFGLVSTHLAPFNRARVALAAVSGLASTHLPFAITSQQYSLL